MRAACPARDRGKGRNHSACLLLWVFQRRVLGAMDSTQSRTRLQPITPAPLVVSDEGVRLRRVVRKSHFARALSRSRMIPASARNELFTDLLLGKTLARSASSTTRFVPCANRRAYLPRTPREKSYSPRRSASALAVFFIRFSFSTAGPSRTDDADIVAPVRVDDNQQSSSV